MNPPETTGVIVGGWEYIWASYVIFWVFVGGYAASLFVRSREER
jgi:hypothetical protein